jgi:hypothetical protein
LLDAYSAIPSLGNAAIVDDIATILPRSFKRSRGCLQQKNETAYVHPEDAIVIGFGYCAERNHRCDARVAHEYVRAAEALVSEREYLRRRPWLRYVRADAVRAPAPLRYRSHRVRRSDGIRGVVDDDRGSFQRERFRDGAPDATRSAGDDGYFPAQRSSHDNSRQRPDAMCQQMIIKLSYYRLTSCARLVQPLRLPRWTPAWPPTISPIRK